MPQTSKNIYNKKNYKFKINEIATTNSLDLFIINYTQTTSIFKSYECFLLDVAVENTN